MRWYADFICLGDGREIGEIERAELVADWVRLVEARGQSRHVAANEPSQREDGRGHRRPGGVRQAARELGMDERAVRRGVKIASLSPEAKAVAKASGLDRNQAALLDAAKHKEPVAQVAALSARAEPPAECPSARRYVPSLR